MVGGDALPLVKYAKLRLLQHTAPPPRQHARLCPAKSTVHLQEVYCTDRYIRKQRPRFPGIAA